MGLINKEVEVVLNNRNIKHYENLGCEIPKYKDSRKQMSVKRGTKITVEIKDLLNSSRAKIDVECDGCGKKLENIRWVDYLRYVKEDGKYYCNKCAKNDCNKWKSFKEWCIENNRQDVLDRWDYELNDCKPDEITDGSGEKYYFKCPRELHKSELNNIGNFTNGSDGTMDCNQCNSFAQWGIDNIGEDFLEKYWDYEKNIVDPWKISYGSNTKKVYIKCQEKDYHGSYNMKPLSFTNQNQRCPYCNNRMGKIHILDSLGVIHPEVLKIWSSKNTTSPYKYAPFSIAECIWECPEKIHGDYKRKISNSNLRDFRCPECQYSKGEEEISSHLINVGFMKISQRDYNKLDNIYKINNNYYIPQKEFDGLVGVGNGNLSYDFYLSKYNLLIEYQGEQHEKYIPGFHKSKKDFEYQQEHDRRKKEYAHNNNIRLLEIWYYDFDNIEEILNNELLK